MDAGPLTLVIFGASGDLTARKLVPSLYSLAHKKRLPDELHIVGVARSPFTDDSFRDKMGAAVRESTKDFNATEWDAFAKRIHYVSGDASKPDGIDGLEAWLKEHEAGKPARRLFYLSVAPTLYGDIATRIASKKLNKAPGGWSRLIIEKPFGHDLQSAKELNKVLWANFEESQLYRIDHYLGKETVQNMLVFRFANTLFEPVWNHNYIDHVQITVAETVTVGNRGDYYDKSGVLRDMFQNHLLQLMTLVAMEAPARFAAEQLRNEKVKVLDAIKIPTEAEARQNVMTAQYAGYRQEKGVAAGTHTPTFAVVQMSVDNWRWRGVPFYLRSGKALNNRLSEVVVQFRCPPHLMFTLPPGATLQCNQLSICLQPDEGIHVNFQTKVPDTETIELHPADLEFHYRNTYGDHPLPESYERLLQDAIAGDASLFMRSDEIERAWEIMDPVIAAAEASTGPQPEEYVVGSKGPAGADAFLAKTGRSWLSLCAHEEKKKG